MLPQPGRRRRRGYSSRSIDDRLCGVGASGFGRHSTITLPTVCTEAASVRASRVCRISARPSRSWLAARLRVSSRVRTSGNPGARLLLRAAAEASHHEVAGLDALVAQAAVPMRAEVEALLRRLAPAAAPEAVSVAAGFFLLVGTRFAESAPELSRFGLRSPGAEAEFEQFFEPLWCFLRAGVLALLSRA